MIIIPKKGEKTSWVREFDVDGNLEKYAKQNPVQLSSSQLMPNANPQIVKGFIYVPSINLYIAKDRILQNKNWYECHKELQANGSSMPTIKEFVEFLKYLKSNPNGVQNASSQEVSTILDDILTVREPWRSEWLDAQFEKKAGKMHINYGHELQAYGNLIPRYSEKLEDCLTKDKTPGINLNDWIVNPSKQGLPRANVRKGDTYYWNPRREVLLKLQPNAVARFGAYSDRAGLGCGWDPDDRDDGLRVRAVRRESP